MKSLGEIMSGSWRDRLEQKIADAQERVSAVKETSGDQHEKVCAVCDGTQWVRAGEGGAHVADRFYQEGDVFPCPVCRAIEHQHAERLRLRATLPEGSSGMTFRGFRANTGALKAIVNETMAWVQEPEGVLYLWGAPGVGKTHIAVSVARYLLDKGFTTRYLRMVDLTRSLRDSVGSTESGALSKIVNDLERCELLVLDDLMNEHVTSFVYEHLYAILDHRYISSRATVITSNVAVEELQWPRLVSRLQDAEVSTIIPFATPDFRPTR